MKYVIVILLVSLMTISLMGCGTAPASDPTFSPYTSQFEKDFSIDVSSTHIHFVDSESQFTTQVEAGSQISGECEESSNEIRILKSEWDSMMDESKYMLIYHELGHCVFHRAHVADVVEQDGSRCYNSIMTASLPGPSCWESENAIYIKEMADHESN